MWCLLLLLFAMEVILPTGPVVQQELIKQFEEISSYEVRFSSVYIFEEKNPQVHLTSPGAKFSNCSVLWITRGPVGKIMPFFAFLFSLFKNYEIARKIYVPMLSSSSFSHSSFLSVCQLLYILWISFFALHFLFPILDSVFSFLFSWKKQARNI